MKEVLKRVLPFCVMSEKNVTNLTNPRELMMAHGFWHGLQHGLNLERLKNPTSTIPL